MTDERHEFIDVSHWEPTVDWQTVRLVGHRELAYVKATESLTLVDPLYLRHTAAARRAGLRVGAFHYFHPGQDAVAQAEHFFRVAGEPMPTDLAPAIDLEEHGQQVPDDVVSQVLRFVARAEALFGRRLTIYTFEDFWHHVLGDPLVPSLASRPLWMARYGSNPPAPTRTWPHWNAWQYADGRAGAYVDPVAGAGRVDKSVLLGPVSQLMGT